MSNLTIYERDSVLVVDSRLIADSLSIKHKNFLATIEKYQIKIESSFGAVRVEVSVSTLPLPSETVLVSFPTHGYSNVSTICH